MSHVHDIIDTDSHFIIDPITRTITTESDKLVVTQYDHNSERFKFKIPLTVEGHDMSLCDRVEVHFTNITRNKKEENSDVYIVTDLEKVDDFCFFSWLISRSATQLVGTLKFSVTFKCRTKNGNVTYEWGTSVYDDVKIIAKLENTENVVDAYPDLYEQLKKDIPTKVSEFENDSGYITSEDIPEVPEQVQSDWNQTDNTKKDFIKNKPSIPEQAQSDWNQTDNTKKDFIKNKPTKLSAFENDLDIITPEVMLTIMDEAQLVQPIADVDNSVLVTDDDKILIL